MSDIVYDKAGADAKFATNVALFNETARAEAAEAGALQKSSNLADLPNKALARAALGIVDAAAVVDNGDGTFTVDPSGLIGYTKAGADAAINSEATTARAAELALRNLTDTTFKTNLSATYARRAVAEFYPMDYGDKTASFTNVNLAITDINTNHGGVGKIVLRGSLNWTADVTLNLSGIHPAFDAGSGPTISLEGYGHLLTTVTATAGLASSGFGFAELVGSNLITIKGITFNTGANTLNYGVLTGRTTGDASAGRHVFEDVYIHGSFTVAGLFALSSENCTYRDFEVLTNAGHGAVLARDLGGWTITAKYAALTTTVPETGGNGSNQFDGVRLMTTRAPTGTAPFAGGTGDSPLVVEYTQAFVGEKVYMLTGGAPHIWINKDCNQFKITGLQQELNSGTAPTYGVYVSAPSGTYTDPKVVRVSFDDCTMYPIYGETGVTFSQLRMNGGWRITSPTMSWQVDVDTADLADLPVSYTATEPWEVPTPAYRRRSGNSRMTRDVHQTSFGVGADQAWPIPTGCVALRIEVCAGGGGSGSGARQPSGTATSGGASGGCGGYSDRFITIQDLLTIYPGTTTLYATAGAAGTSGASVTTDSTNGNPGTNGSPSYVAQNTGGVNILIRASGGAGGQGGSTATANGGAGGLGRFPGQAGASCAVGAAGQQPLTTPVSSSGAGGSGAGVSATPAAFAGGNGYPALEWSQTGAAGGAAGANGTAGNPAPEAQVGPGAGGGGGGSSTSAAGGNGGTAYGGASGGGGGSSINGQASGAGGASGAGWVRITAYF